MDEIYSMLSETAIVWVDMDEAIIGVSDKGLAIYSIPMLILICMVKHKMTEEEATEYVEFNMLNAYLGEDTPIHMWPKEYESE